MRHVLFTAASSTPEFGNCYIKIEWVAHVQEFYRVIIRLAYVVTPPEDPEAYHRCLRRINRPRNQQELSRWLTAVHADPCHPVEWRLEVEMGHPCSQGALVRGLYLHHLLRLLVQPAGGGAIITRQQFVQLFRHHFPASTTTTIHGEAFARELMATVVRRHGLGIHPVSLYPVQPRPFDLTGRDLGRLCESVATPKVNGLPPRRVR